MSGYFQSLIQQSNLHLNTQPDAPASVLNVPTEHVRPARATSAELTEIHEEISFPASPANSFPVTPAPAETQSTASFSQSAPAESSSATSPLSASTPATDFVIREQVEFLTRPSPIAATVSSSGKKSSQENVSVDRPAAAKPPTAPTNISTPEGIPPELMQAVMRWIGDGQPASATGKQNSANQEIREAQSSSSVQIEAPVPAKETPVAISPSIPERVIEIIEEHFESAASPIAEPVISPRATATRTSVPVPRVAPTPSVEPVQVSIGSINVRIETPPVAPAVVHAPRAEPSRAAPTSRSSNFSKLRRHYILPH